MNRITRILFASLLALVLSSCTGKQPEIEVYSFHGSNEMIGVQNGVIVVNNQGEDKFVGGQLVFIRPLPHDVAEYWEEFYYSIDGQEESILSSIVVHSENGEATSVQGGISTENLILNSDLGSISAPSLIKDIEALTQSFTFSFSGTYANGDPFQLQFPIDIERVY